MNNGQRTIEQAAPPVVSQWGEPLTPPCVRELRSSPSAKCPPGILLRAHTRRFVKQWDTSATLINQIKVNSLVWFSSLQGGISAFVTSSVLFSPRRPRKLSRIARFLSQIRKNVKPGFFGSPETTCTCKSIIELINLTVKKFCKVFILQQYFTNPDYAEN